MAGFNKAVVLDSLRGHLEDASKVSDAQHAEQVKKWEEERRAIQNAKKRLRQYVRDLTDGKAAIEEFAKNVASGFDRYGGWGVPATRNVGEKPKRVDTVREKQFKRVIAVIESSDQETVTVADLRALGVLDFVKLPASCR